jgi:hypothetical protein
MFHFRGNQSCLDEECRKGNKTPRESIECCTYTAGENRCASQTFGIVLYDSYGFSLDGLQLGPIICWKNARQQSGRRSSDVRGAYRDAGTLSQNHLRPHPTSAGPGRRGSTTRTGRAMGPTNLGYLTSRWGTSAQVTSGAAIEQKVFCRTVLKFALPDFCYLTNTYQRPPRDLLVRILFFGKSCLSKIQYTLSRSPPSQQAAEV